MVHECLLRCWKLLVVQRLPGNASLLIGMDAVQELGGMTLSVAKGGQISVEFGPQPSVVAAAVLRPRKLSAVLEDADFCAEFDGQRWEVAWKWKCDPPMLKNRVAEYAVEA